MNDDIALLGLGTMGRKIVLLCLMSGFDVMVMSSSYETSKEHIEQIAKDLKSKVAKGQLKPEQVDSMLARLRLVGDLKDLAEVHFVIEAITEEVAANEALYWQIEPHLDKLLLSQMGYPVSST